MIPGYKAIQLLHENKRFKVVRALRIEDEVNFTLKLPVQKVLTEKDLKNLEDEYRHACLIKSPYVVKYYSLNEYSPNSWVFIQEDIDGTSLAKAIPINGFEIGLFLKIAKQIVSGLEAIHQQGIIHKGIKPSNIIINHSLDQIKIIDFGSSIQLRQENQPMLWPSQEAETLAYISPEQTGRINRNIDYRTDFYSLGTTFYELLVGKVPFSEPDAICIVHQHIARQPVAPHKVKQAIPLFLSHSIMKLLAKNPEERYQSCQGILHDLNQCLAALQTGDSVPLSELGKQDFPEEFIMPQKLYDRENERDILLKTFERTSLGNAEALMVAGHAGIGKTMLINEIQKPLTLKKGYFISGKFDQLNKNTAYSAIIQAFQSLIRQLLIEGEAQINCWKEKLHNAIGSNSQLIIDVIPELESVLGKQPSVPMLSPMETKNRFNLVFKNFISVFTQKEHPLVLFLDNLQWADYASLDLIKSFITDPATQYFLFIGAYRDNEISDLYPAAVILEKLRKANVRIQKITLAPLNFSTVERWLADTLTNSLADIAPLTEIIYQKTHGNPFFIKMFLQALYDEKLIKTTISKTWQWDLQRINKRRSTDDGIEFMASCIQQLPESAQQLMSLASCFGHHVNFDLLKVVSQKNRKQILQELQVVFNRGLIYQANDSIYFAHDCIQEAAYSLLSNKKQTHLLIGRLMLKHDIRATQPDAILVIIEHFNKGYELMQDDQERLQLARLNLEAGKKAKSAIAYKTALNYLNASLAYLIGHDIWTKDYHLAFALYKEVAEVEFLNGNFEKSYSLIQQMLMLVKNPSDKAEINMLLLVQKTLQGNYAEAISIGRHSLKQLNIELPEAELKASIQHGMVHVQAKLQNQDTSSLLSLPNMIDAEKMAAMKLLSNLIVTTYMNDHELYFIIALRMVDLSVQYGHTPEACTGYAAYGALLCAMEKYQAGYEFANLALKLSEKFHSLREKCQALVMALFFVYPWVKPLPFIKDLEEKAYQASLESGELRFAGYISGNMLANSFYQGDFLADIALKVSHRSFFVDKMKYQNGIDFNKAMQLTINYLINPLSKAANTSSRIMDHCDFELSCFTHNSFLALCFYQLLKAEVSYLMGDCTQALDSILEAQKKLAYMSGFVMNAAYNQYYSLILVKLYPKQTEEIQKNYLSQLEKNQSQLLSWSNSCPENFLHHYILIEAEITRIKHNPWEALKLYNQAIQLAHKNKFIQDEALANELAAEFFNANDQEQLAKDYMQKAHALYKYWGAVAKVQQLEKAYPQLLPNFSTPRVFESLMGSTEAPFINLDTHTLKQTEEQLCTAFTGSNSALTSTNIGTWSWDLVSGKVDMDKNMFTLLDIDPGHYHHTLAEIFAMIHPNDREHINTLLKRCIIEHIDYEAEYRIIKKDRTIHYVSARAKIYYKENQPIRLVGSAWDITLKKERQQLREAEAANVLKTQFFTNISHEFRTPLTLMLGPLEDSLVDSQYPLPPVQRERQIMIQNNALRLLKLVNSLLDFSRLEAKRIQAIYEATDLAQLTTDLSGVFRSAIEKADLQLIVETPVLNEPVYVDKEMWEKIIFNLLSNALKYTLKGSIHVSLKRKNDHVELKVQDTGVGIPNADIPHLFDRFHRVESTKGRSFEGTGIGLALIQELIKLHGGSIQVESQVGQGSTFIVTIPLGTAHLPQEKLGAKRESYQPGHIGVAYVKEALSWLPEKDLSLTSAVTTSPPMAKGYVLLVEDNADMRQYIKSLLTAHWKVEAVDNGESALQAIASCKPDLILTDIMMPKMDGFQLLRAVRADKLMQHIPVIILSARTREETKIEGLTAGADDYLIKPFSAKELIARINTHLELSRLRLQLEALVQQRTLELEQVYKKLNYELQTRHGIELEMQNARIKTAETYRKNLEEFIDAICHEIRNPLNGIYGNIDMLKTIIKTMKDLKATNLVPQLDLQITKLEEPITVIAECARYQKTIVDDVLELSKLESKVTELKKLPFKPKEIIHTVVKMFATEIAKKQLVIAICLPEEDIIIKNDPDSLKKVLINLVGNAVKFTSAGSITVRMNMQKAIKPDEMILQFQVEDTGTGLTEHEQARIFNRFLQGHRNVGEQYGASGLGLSISKQLIHLMGGEISVKSQLGKGSIFYFTISCPLASLEEKVSLNNQEKRMQVSSPVAESSTASKTVLIVEDNIFNQKILAKFLQSDNHSYEIANNGLEALNWVEKKVFDLIFMDIEMPVMNGLAATQTIRKREAEANKPAIPIIGLSANANDQHKEAAMSAGMNDYITKPYNKLTIINCLSRWTSATKPTSPQSALAVSTLKQEIQGTLNAATEGISQPAAVPGTLFNVKQQTVLSNATSPVITPQKKGLTQ